MPPDVVVKNKCMKRNKITPPSSHPTRACLHESSFSPGWNIDRSYIFLNMAPCLWSANHRRLTLSMPTCDVYKIKVILVYEIFARVRLVFPMRSCIRQILLAQVRMAERSKVPDSRPNPSQYLSGWVFSGVSWVWRGAELHSWQCQTVFFSLIEVERKVRIKTTLMLVVLYIIQK